MITDLIDVDPSYSNKIYVITHLIQKVMGEYNLIGYFLHSDQFIYTITIILAIHSTFNFVIISIIAKREKT